MEKSYLDLTGRPFGDVQRELAVLAVSLRALKGMDKNDKNYKNVYEDIEDRMRGFRNYFGQGVEALLETVE